ncbi:MAG TPA: hypothetical protein DC060_08015 [Gemmatimonadetes bacterium]|jgi:hypothetical protein|nr:hypothetical protein [Gemmatimonadota bacterium]|tara:strand:+ start:1562 stop:2113 length:552 start_codon:yes stop_codon:yes gene_type:complete
MTTARQGRLTVAAIATALLFSTHLSAQTSQASQTEGAVGLTDEFVDVLVGAMSLADPLSPPPHQDTEQLFAVLVNDLLVAAVLMDAGAVGIDLPSDVGASPWQSTAERAQALLAQGAPQWFTSAIQVSVDLDLSVVMPLNVLLVLAVQPDASMREFLSEHGLEADAVADAAREALRAVGCRSG